MTDQYAKRSPVRPPSLDQAALRAHGLTEREIGKRVYIRCPIVRGRD